MTKRERSQYSPECIYFNKFTARLIRLKDLQGLEIDQSPGVFAAVPFHLRAPEL